MSCSKWLEYTLDELVEIIGGGTPKTSIEEYWNGNINWISIKDFNGDNKYITSTEKRITELGLNKSSTKLLRCKDIIISARGTVGALGVIKRPMAFNQSCYGLRAKELVDSDFLYYLMKNCINILKNNTHGSVFDTITKDTFKNINVTIPEKSCQIQIARILSKLDEKIELNNEMNKTLEEMAQTLFKRWFVDFEFPNEEGKPYKTSDGEMVESDGMGKIPSGWRIIHISEIIDIKDGTHASPKPKEKGYPLITSKHISGDKIDFNSANLISKEDYDEVNKRSKVDTGDILISMIGTVGLIHLIQEEQINFAIKNVGLFKSSQKRELSEYLYLFLKSNQMKNYIESRLAGTTQKYISLGELRKIKFILPNEKILNRFNIIAKNIFDKKRNNIEQIETLKEARDSLLTKLMSGEIRVNSIEVN